MSCCFSMVLFIGRLKRSCSLPSLSSFLVSYFAVWLYIVVTLSCAWKFLIDWFLNFTVTLLAFVVKYFDTARTSNLTCGLVTLWSTESTVRALDLEEALTEFFLGNLLMFLTQLLGYSSQFLQCKLPGSSWILSWLQNPV